MASSSTSLCPQNNKREETRFLKHQEVHKDSESLRAKPHTVQSSKRGSENQDPNEAAKPTNAVNKLRSVTRLPVLKKSIQPVLTDISQSPGHKRWEERPLLGKAQKRKTCTKPVPFNFSKSRPRSQKSNEADSGRARSGVPLNLLTQQIPSKTLSAQQCTQQRTKTLTRNTALGNAHVDLTDNKKTFPLSLKCHTGGKSKLNSTQSGPHIEKDTSNEVGFSIQKDLSTQLGSITLAHAKLNKDQIHSFRTGGVEEHAVYQPKAKSCIQTLLSSNCTTAAGSAVSFSPDPPAVCSTLQNETVKKSGSSGPTPHISGCPSGRGTPVNSAQRIPVKKFQTDAATSEPGPAGNAVPFSPDPSALRNILMNEGIKAIGPVGATPRVSTCPAGRKTSVFSAQRVPIKKPPTEAATTVPGRTGNAVPFSPDPSALRNILLNEGIKANGPVGATPRVSTCPSGRGNSIYSAQRVPLKKAGAEATQTGASRTPNTKWTPQRVPCSQSQSLRRLISARKTASSALSETQASCTDSSAQQEEDVVLRLFQEEPEKEESEQMEEGDEATSGSSQEHQQTVKQHLKQEANTEKNHCLLEKEKVSAGQPFIQAQHRQSVIVFSSGQRLFGSDLTKEVAQTPPLQISTRGEHLQPCSSNTESAESVQSSGSQSALNLDCKRTLSKTKASGLSSAVYALRKRLPPLEEMFLDDECATYTSRQQLWPAMPRCSNPVASTLLFQDSTCFLPIGLTSPNLSPHLPSEIMS
ncbi:tastin [Hoplias malabaricus]|uniref:tastin n=1 Tax=Hoplias malabaricus TaxID=27720 RepID=UPI0034618398